MSSLFECIIYWLEGENIRDVVHESREWLHSLHAKVVELTHQLLCAFFLDGGGVDRAGFIGKEISIISLCQVQLDVYKILISFWGLISHYSFSCIEQ